MTPWKRQKNSQMMMMKPKTMKPRTMVMMKLKAMMRPRTMMKPKTIMMMKPKTINKMMMHILKCQQTVHLQARPRPQTWTMAVICVCAPKSLIHIAAKALPTTMRAKSAAPDLTARARTANEVAATAKPVLVRTSTLHCAATTRTIQMSVPRNVWALTLRRAKQENAKKNVLVHENSIRIAVKAKRTAIRAWLAAMDTALSTSNATKAFARAKSHVSAQPLKNQCAVTKEHPTRKNTEICAWLAAI
mmetsp:Transcript_71560/g.113905  ORF Transcript_71560/g.113905 Transcript_71560/m.113905 type:complete len:246 (+) Transcript_71560:1097-1834(+)